MQFIITDVRSLTELDNDEKRIRDQRLKWYNPSSHYLRVIFYRLDLKNFLEGDVQIASYRLQRNFFESLDPNVYFFGGHPRQRVWANDFEKFPFIYVFPFLIGLYQLIKRKSQIIWIWLGISIILLSVIGHKNPFGPFILFPMFPLVILLGVPKNLPKWAALVFLILIILITIQTFIYAT